MVRGCRYLSLSPIRVYPWNPWFNPAASPGSLRFAAGDAQEDFFKAEFVFTQCDELRAATDQGVRNDTVVGVMTHQRDLDLAIQGSGFGDFRPGFEEFDRGCRI